MDLDGKKLALFDAHLSHKGLQYLVDAAAALLGNPIFMADMSMRIVFKSSDMGTGVQDYSAEGDLDRQNQAVRQAADAGFLDWIYRHDKPVIGEFEDEPRYLSARVRDGSHVLGHIVVVEIAKRFEEEDELLLPIVCQTISFELRRTRVDDLGAQEHAPMLEELLAGNMVDEDAAQRRIAAVGVPLPQPMRILVFRNIDKGRTVSQAYLHTQLDKAFPHTVGLPYQADYIRVVDGTLKLKDVDTTMRSLVYTGGMAIGSSRTMRKATALHLAYLQADAAIRLGSGTDGGPLRRYDDIAAQHLLEFARQAGMDEEAALSPAIYLLREFDAANQADYTASLAAYLNSGRNVARAASALHVHKNSMYYRIQRIEELAGVDLSDEQTCFLLQLSLAMLGQGPTSR